MQNKSCPFCGSSQLSIEYSKPAWGGTKKEAHVVCDDCASSSPIYIWNQRNTPLTSADSTQATTGQSPIHHK